MLQFIIFLQLYLYVSETMRNYQTFNRWTCLQSLRSNFRFQIFTWGTFKESCDYRCFSDWCSMTSCACITRCICTSCLWLAQPTALHRLTYKYPPLPNETPSSESNIAQHESEIWSQDWRPANNSAVQRHGHLFQLLLPNLGRGRASLASPASVMSLTSWKDQVIHWFHLQAIDFHVISKFHVKFTWTATCFLDLISDMEDESLKTSTSSVQKLLWWPNLIFMIWGRNFFFAALFLPQIRAS